VRRWKPKAERQLLKLIKGVQTLKMLVLALANLEASVSFEGCKIRFQSDFFNATF